ncbi:MAG: threonine synthase [Cyclobacteriaceae bacterium]|nr:threonine synthase [Cyclobacteriaceae bacterium]
MKFYSTRNPSHTVSFEQAVRKGLAPDGGLYMPESISSLPTSFWKDFDQKSFRDVSFEVAKHFLQGALQDDDLRRIVDHTLQFDAPLVQIESNVFSLELFHGPTLAFKDFGARFLAAVLGHLADKKGEEITILVATSGDTGSAVAQGFYRVPGTKVVVLYPSGKVSELQEKQFATLGENITALEVDGTFDDCQRMVKQAFGDEELQSKRVLTSANSINIARLLPQTFYYFRAFQQLPELQRSEVIISVPSGNFGNLTAGLMSKRMGLPVKKFIAATNLNDVVPAYLKSGIFQSRPSVSTISNAMDVGDPSNFSRMLDLYRHDFAALSKDVVGCVVPDEETKSILKNVHQKDNYILDPHGAVGYKGLKNFLIPQETGIFLETAHPAKFRETVEAAIGRSVVVPERLQKFLSSTKKSVPIRKSFEDLKDFLINKL